MFPFDDNAQQQKVSAIASLGPLVNYQQADMTSTFWRNTGSLGPEYDLDAVWGPDSCQIVQNAQVGQMLRTETIGGGLRTGLYTSAAVTTIAQEVTVSMVYVFNAAQGLSWLYGGAIATSPYCFVGVAPSLSLNAGVTFVNANTTQDGAVAPQWIISKSNGNNSKIKGSFSAQATGAAGNNNLKGVTLGATSGFAGGAVALQIATLFITKGKSLLEIQAAIEADFPSLA